MSDNTDEILGKIEEAHMRGEHTLGVFAGCTICARQAAAAPGISGAADAPSMLEELARRVPADDESAAAAPVISLRTGSRPGSIENEPSLADVALQDAQAALDTANLAREHHNPALWSDAQTSALVGVVRALAGLEETIGRVLTRLEFLAPEPEPASGYPHRDGDIVTLGPEVIATADGRLLDWRGVSYVPQDPTEPAA